MKFLIDFRDECLNHPVLCGGIAGVTVLYILSALL
jgi:hypothetical protein